MRQRRHRIRFSTIVREKHVSARIDAVREKHVRADREKLSQIALRTAESCRRRNNIFDFSERLLHCNISNRFRLNKRIVALLTR